MYRFREKPDILPASTEEAAVKAVLTVISWLAGNTTLKDDADVMNTVIMDNDRRYFCAVGTYDTKGQTLDSGLC